jgi:prepilin-type N-terminal cleavage/methylation domain-containing protein
MTFFLKNRRGFTLIETLVVVAILAALTGVSIITYVYYQDSNRIDSAARQVVQYCYAARQHAITNNVTTRVVFILEQGYVGVDVLIDEPTDEWQEAVVDYEKIDEHIEITDIDDATDARQYILFYPNGTSENKMVHLLRKGADSGDDANFYTVEVISSTGYAQIHPEEKRTL